MLLGYAGMQQATTDLDNDLRARMRSLGGRTEARVDEEAPTDDLVFEAWLQKMGVFEAGEGSRLARELPEAFAPVLARLGAA